MMNQFNLFLELIRFKKPIGFMLLFWPCAWGLTIAYDFSKSLSEYFYYLILFFLGAILMRSAGCIVNDISDRKFDKRVERTKLRPIASGAITVKLASVYVIVLCLLALLVLINFNNLTILFALGSMPLAFTYPLIKRFTYWPQLFLGITFNYGLVLGWVCIKESLDLTPFILYLGAIFWTTGYDTIYGYQDIKDDEIIGLKSTSIKFKDKPFIFLNICYLIFIFCTIFVGVLMKFNYLYFISLIIPILHLLYFQIRKLDIDNPNSCLKTFKSNNYLGLVILTCLIIGKF
jgi:4-hydroxybenzoate polyprenyltransferase